MKLNAVLCLFACVTLSCSAGPTTFPPHTVAGSVLRVLPRTRPDRLYQLHIGLPAGFSEHAQRRYPVVFVTDGYWDFTTVAAIYGNFFYAKNVPEMIVVGLGYAGENLDYDRIRSDDLGPIGGVNGEGGHAEQFLDMIEHVAIPLLEKEYRADPQHRYLMGCSMGGLFTLYTALTRPDLFQGYVADSPSVGSAFPYERAFAAAGRSIRGRVFISEAENEWPAYRDLIRVFAGQLEKDGVVKGGLKFRRAENVRHAGSKPETYAQGLLYVTAPIAPETGAQHDYLFDPQGRPLYGVYYWPKAQGEKTNAALAEHAAWLGKIVADQRVLTSGATPKEAKQAFSGFLLFSGDRAAVEALAKSSPAVQAGVADFGIFSSNERP